VDREHVQSSSADDVANVAYDEGFVQRKANYSATVLDGLGIAEGDDTDDARLYVLRKILDCPVGDGGTLAVVTWSESE
jgi:hypothetical protein